MSVLSVLRRFFGITADSALSFARSERLISRNNKIHDLHDSIMESLGEYRNFVSRSYVYGKISADTGLSVRQISRILNHTKKEVLYGEKC